MKLHEDDQDSYVSLGRIRLYRTHDHTLYRPHIINHAREASYYRHILYQGHLYAYTPVITDKPCLDNNVYLKIPTNEDSRRS